MRRRIVSLFVLSIVAFGACGNEDDPTLAADGASGSRSGADSTSTTAASATSSTLSDAARKVIADAEARVAEIYLVEELGGAVQDPESERSQAQARCVAQGFVADLGPSRAVELAESAADENVAFSAGREYLPETFLPSEIGIGSFHSLRCSPGLAYKIDDSLAKDYKDAARIEKLNECGRKYLDSVKAEYLKHHQQDSEVKTYNQELIIAMRRACELT